MALDSISSGSQNFKLRPGDGAGTRFLRFRRLLNVLWLRAESEMVALPSIDLVVYEEVAAHKGAKAAHVYGGFQACLQEFAEDRGVSLIGVPVGTIKKFATGNGRASKAEMVKAARDYGYVVSDDNEADALCLLKYAMHTYPNEMPRP